MSTEPLKQARPPIPIDDQSVTGSSCLGHVDQPTKSPGEDPEGGYTLDIIDHRAFTDIEASNNLTFSQIVNHIWHFCSVDYGHRCTNCLDGFVFYVANQFSSFLYWI